MSKTLLTLFVIAAAGCGGEPPFYPPKFRTSLNVQGSGQQRTFLIGLDDPEYRHQFDQMAVAGNFLYFNIPWYGVYRMPKYGGEVQPIEEANGIEDFRGIATNETDVYWARMSSFGSAGPDFPHSRLRRQALGGGSVQTVAEGDIGIVASWLDARAFHAGADALYSAVSYPQKDYVDLTRFPVDGGTSKILWRLTIDPSSGPAPAYFVFDDPLAYISSCDPIGGAACALTRIDVRTGASDTFSTTAGPQEVVAVDATDLYLVSAHQLLRRPKDRAGDATVLASFEGNQWPTPMAVVDDDDVFLILNQSLVSVPKSGGTTRTLTTGLEGGADALAQDERNIFVMYDWMSIDIVPKTSVAAIP